MFHSSRLLPAWALVVACALTTPFAAQAQTMMQARLRGTVERINGPELTVKARNGDDVAVRLSTDAVMTALVRAAMEDVKRGVYIGTAARTLPDGTLQAVEVHIFEEEWRGTGEGHRPMDAPDTTMTNANIASVVQDARGRTLKLAYKGGEQTVAVPEGTPIVRYVTGKRSEVTVGTEVTLTVQPGPNGSVEAIRVTFGRNGARLPEAPPRG